jgi:hypothetical protein
MEDKAVYISHDNVELFEGDNFWFLVSDIVNGKLIYHIKYWDCNVMESFAENRLYLDDKLKFLNKDEIKKYILANNLEVRNFNLIFVL